MSYITKIACCSSQFSIFRIAEGIRKAFKKPFLCTWPPKQSHGSWNSLPGRMEGEATTLQTIRLREDSTLTDVLHSRP